MPLLELSATIVLQRDDNGSLMRLWMRKYGQRDEYATDDEQVVLDCPRSFVVFCKL